MAETKLESTLRSIVRQYGFEKVSQALRDVKNSDRGPKRSNHSGRHKMSSNSGAVVKPRKKRTKLSAPEYVTRANISSEKKPLVAELARRFEDKSFLPALADIRNFCQIYGIDELGSKSRSSAVPRVFKFIAAMETDDIRRILNDGMFSGPSRLRPIADAIRSSAGLRTVARSPTARTPAPSSSLPDTEAASSPDSPGVRT